MKCYERCGYLIESGSDMAVIVRALRDSRRGALADKVDLIECRSYLEPAPKPVEVDIEVVVNA
jgi:hypothetical protein